MYSIQNTFSNIALYTETIVWYSTTLYIGFLLTAFIAVSSRLCEKIQIIDLDKDKS